MNKFILLVNLLCLLSSGSYAQDCTCKEFPPEKDVSPELLLRSSNTLCKAKGYEQIVSSLLNKKELDSAGQVLLLAEKIYKDAGCSGKNLLTVHKLRSSLHFFSADYKQALDYSLKVLSILQNDGQLSDEADALLGISQIFARMGQPEKGLQYTRQSLPLIQQLQTETAKVELLNKAGSRYYYFYQDVHEGSLLDSAALFFNEALKTAKQIGYKKGMQTSYNKMNTLAYQQKNYPLALLYIDSALALATPGELSTVHAASFGDKGNLLLKMGKFSEAKRWADSCLYYNQQIKFPPLIANAYSLVAEIADSLGDHETAYEALYAEKKITDSLNTADKARAVNEVEKKYNQAKNEKTIKELYQQKQIYFLLAVAGLLVAGLVAFFFRQQALKSKQKILETEQRLNRARMNPHFFFNALTALQRFALKENDGKSLASNLSKFSNIMRETLESTYKEYVTVKQEIEFLKEYMEIQKMRFPTMFSYSLMVDGEMEPTDVMIPSM
ncbi:MAG: histidine kinase, partial [Chitinophagaceae bacterium]|nr:histidine kinase [Chitinophagaceae bacterium]